MAAEVKELIDESGKRHGKLVGKGGGAFASSGGPGGGNETTVLDIVKALRIRRMIVDGDAQGDHYGPIAVGGSAGAWPSACCGSRGERERGQTQHIEGVAPFTIEPCIG